MKPIESRRVPLDRRIALSFPDIEGFVLEYAANLSMSGMFVRSERTHPPGTPVSFELRLEDGAPLVRGEGWVVWCRGADEPGRGPAGMGIEFGELDEKSRRFVRWLILSQLPEGAAPYDVRTVGGQGSEGRESAAFASAPRRRTALAAAALVVLVALAALWFGKADRDGAAPADRAEVVAAVGAEPVEALQSSDSAAGVSEAAESPAAGLGEVTPEHETNAQGAAVEDAVQSWAQAWSDQDVERYLAHYSAAFVPERGLSRERWVEQRRQRIESPGSIRVALTRLETRARSASEARVSFLQTYRSDGYADTVDKVLELEFEDGAWKIRRELAD